MNSPRHPLSALLLCGLLLLVMNAPAQAGSATWNLNPTNGDWNTANNWTPNTVPNGPSDTATFGVSNTPAVTLSAATEVNSIVFNASAFTITAPPILTLTVSGTGITNNSGITQSLGAVVEIGHSGGGTISFTGSATAGSNTDLTLDGSINVNSFGGQMFFYDNSTAGSSFITTYGSQLSFGGRLIFYGNSTAGDSTITNNGGVYPGETIFTETSTAGNCSLRVVGATVAGEAGGSIRIGGSASAEDASFTITAGAKHAFNAWVVFSETSSAGNATLTAEGGPDETPGAIVFIQHSSGGTARVTLSGEASLQLQTHNYPGLTIGSLEGTGFVFLGKHNLSVGSNNLDTAFGGVIQGEGTLTKIGKGTLVLTGAAAYLGGTFVERGRLLVNNITGSGTGQGSVQVNSGTLGGKGIIVGAVTVGIGDANTAVLAPGTNGPGLLTLQNTLAFGSNGTYNWNISTNTSRADQVVAQGVTIESGADFAVFARGNTTLPLGTIFTAISNTAVTPITGTFSNLQDGSTLTVASNTFQANYEGGDGNDLTLTVVP